MLMRSLVGGRLPRTGHRLGLSCALAYSDMNDDSYGATAPPSMQGQVALVTGGGSGIGAALCARLSARGATVVVADVDESGRQAVATELDAHAISLDVTSKTAWHEAMAQLMAQHGRLDAVALNAGVMTRPRGVRGDDDPLHWMMERYEAMRSVNSDGVVYGSWQRPLSSRRAAGGRIVVTASGAGLAPLPMDPAYAMTKHGVVGLVRSIATVACRTAASPLARCARAASTPPWCRPTFASSTDPSLPPTTSPASWRRSSTSPPPRPAASG